MEDTTANARLVALGTHSLGASVVDPPSTPAEMLAVDSTPSASLKAPLPSASAPLESPTATHWWSAPPKKVRLYFFLISSSKAHPPHPRRKMQVGL